MSPAAKRALMVLPLAAFLALAVTFLRQIDKDPSVLPSALLDKPMPALALPKLIGEGELTTQDFKSGAPSVLNVFASWCQPCWAEHDVVAQLAARGVSVYGLAYKDAPGDTRRFLTRLGNPYVAVGVDQSGRSAIDLGVYGAPETYVIDGQGIIRHRHVGALTPATVESVILPLLSAVDAS